MSKRNVLIFLDFTVLVMSISWAFYSLLRGIDWVELVYLYVYYILITFTLILNLILLFEKKRNNEESLYMKK